MTAVGMFQVVFLVVVVIIGFGGFVYALRSGCEDK